VDLGVGLLVGASPGEVMLGGLVAQDHAPVHDGVLGTVELAVAEAVETVTADAAGGCLQRADPGERGEGGFGAASASVRPGDDQMGRADRTDAGFGQQGG
jgi:hypothetical protein